MKFNLPSPTEKISFSEIESSGVELFIKRDDLIHPEISGNKWRKLKHNLEKYKKNKGKRLVTFGGPFSNHIYAVAAACKEFNIPALAYIRGEDADLNNPTLKFAQECGMVLKPVTREDYKANIASLKIEAIKEEKDSFFVHEGGTNRAGALGVAEMYDELDQSFDIIATAVGTGGTISGLIKGMNNDTTQILGFSSLKGAQYLEKEIPFIANRESSQWSINHDYHFDGYAKINKELVEFMDKFKTETGIQLDPIYTGKMMFGLIDQIKKGEIKSGSKILAIHSGGLQGLKGMESKMNELRA
jgi:1-aminocyclopropane-1-carboxylate deaminase